MKFCTKTAELGSKMFAAVSWISLESLLDLLLDGQIVLV